MSIPQCDRGPCSTQFQFVFVTLQSFTICVCYTSKFYNLHFQIRCQSHSSSILRMNLNHIFLIVAIFFLESVFAKSLVQQKLYLPRNRPFTPQVYFLKKASLILALLKADIKHSKSTFWSMLFPWIDIRQTTPATILKEYSYCIIRAEFKRDWVIWPYYFPQWGCLFIQKEFNIS